MVNLAIEETSGVDHPAHLHEGWLVMKSAEESEVQRVLDESLTEEDSNMEDTSTTATEEQVVNPTEELTIAKARISALEEELAKAYQTKDKKMSKEDDEEMSEEDVPAEEEVGEAARTKWNVHGGKRAGLTSKKVFAAGAKNETKKASKAINEEVENLRKQNGEYKKALILFKDKLNEVAVFNANLAYATRLFTEHSTTKQEKLNILKKFDSISTINESKNLYNSIKAELDTKKPVTETVAGKIANTASTSSSQEVLSESKAYEAPQFKRMRDLMSKLNK